ncbi:hypothetical protein VT98_10873 [Candidatus Electrothrix communis]|uniref:Uncharacterized protein n=1 Tax=Candidatus Electrothrix communis TaxID=1859133 RepID=A0A444J7F1_9BACT|nr:hypothetical protein VT98_10873 [Candidatus Electrothrix communis]
MRVKILSPTQGTQEIHRLFSGRDSILPVGSPCCLICYGVFFNVAGSDNTQGDIVDSVLDIRIPVEELFVL